jgi:ornithine cyclodeaminase/alanine dehydrogenase-like protein (mu-crystallin family)
MLVLSGKDVYELLTLRECIDAVQEGFRLHAAGRTLGPGVLGIPAVDGGGFHIKAAGLVGERSYFAAKTNANIPGNAARGLPTIQGTVFLADAVTGQPLALMESGSVTALRTAAATAVAARFLARPNARRAVVVGCGVQGALQLDAIAAVLPLTSVQLFDTDHARAEALATRAAVALRIPVEAVKARPGGLRRVRHVHAGTRRVRVARARRAGHVHRRRRRGQPWQAGARAGARRIGHAGRRRARAVRGDRRAAARAGGRPDDARAGARRAR